MKKQNNEKRAVVYLRVATYNQVSKDRLPLKRENVGRKGASNV